MEKTITVSKIKFSPVEINITIKLTSMEELNEFIRFDENSTTIDDYNGEACDNIKELVDEICGKIVAQL